MDIFPPHQIDFYKSGHIYQYPKGTELVFSNFTPRSSRIKGVDRIVFFGLQYFIKEYLVNQWQKNFFDKGYDFIEAEYEDRMHFALGKDVVGTEHIKALHKLGYLPLEIRAVPEGSRVDLRTPMLVIWNTKPEFFWLTNYLESIMSAVLWGGCTSATMANEYKRILDGYANLTGGDSSLVPFQGHDFSFRGMFGLEASCISGAGHLTSFKGTDSVPAIDFVEKYYSLYDMNPNEYGCSVPATEHSVMCLGEEEGEIETIRRLITETYPTGVVSIVCDTWDFWKVITEYLPKLKDEIMARDGKVVVRPDSGDPVKIICGDPDIDDKWGNPARLGAVECLWRTFGGKWNKKGHKELDPHIGLIYGDSITIDRCTDICFQLFKKNFASTNVVFGIGSYTYQYTTRDTFGFAMKATYADVNGVPKNIFKKPKTDDGTKNSAKGLIAVYQRSDSSFYMEEGVTWEEVNNCALELVYRDGVPRRHQTLHDVRENLKRNRCLEGPQCPSVFQYPSAQTTYRGEYLKSPNHNAITYDKI
jgi:nicotinamide phosphoribosyltransferase